MSKGKVNKNIESIYELSPMQQGMLFHTIYNKDSNNYFEQLSVTLVGEIDVQFIKKSWQMLLQRHPVLRTSFVYKNLDKMFQVVHKHVELPFVFEDWSNNDYEDNIKKIEEYLIKDKMNKFDLNNAPLLRVSIIKIAKEEYKLIWSHHHILLDGWSMPIVMKELFMNYESLKNGIDFNPPAIRPYSDYIKYLQTINKEKVDQFWKTYLNGFNEKTPFLNNANESILKETGYKKKTIEFTKEQSASLQNFTKSNKITINTLLQAGWAILLHKYSNLDDIVFGATVSGRPAHLADSGSMVGLFINTLPIRAQISNEINILNWVKEFNISLNDLREYEHSSLVDIQKLCNLPAKQNLFDTLFVFENYPTDYSSNSTGSIKLKDFNSFEETNFPITIISAPGEIIKIDAAYDVGKIEEFRIDLLLNHFKNILQYICSNPHKKIKEIDYLTEDEKNVLLPIKFVELETPKPYVLSKIFEQSVAKYPNNIAVRLNDKSLTYEELNKRANALANHLIERNINRDDLVCIYVERSLDMVVTILGVLKSGAGYVPIDPSYPQSRIEHILEDAEPRFLITESDIFSNIKYDQDKVIFTDTFDELVKTNSTENANIEVFPENIAYMIYTSGSTGKPKGTMIQNRSAVNFIHDFVNSLNVTDDSNVLQFASIGFDASVPELFCPLSYGGTIQLITRNTINELSEFKDYIIANKVSHLFLPPSYLSVLDYFDSPFVKVILSAGEQCSWDIVKKWGTKYKFFNGYGPTEATVGCVWGNFSQILSTKSVPIGLPIFNVKVYVLDKHLNPTPLGASGELYIGGKALARGYFNKPDLTASKFLPNPFSTSGGERIYQSRDLVKVLSDGQLEFIGRVDNQVKIRGFRIEIGEIEAELNNNKQISQSVVLLREEKLIALLVAANNDVDIELLRKDIMKSLPEFMIPAHFEVLSEFPVNTHGKIDRKKLQEYKIEQSVDDNYLNTNLSATEDLLLSLIMDVLKIKNVQLHNSFFELGGHSLLAVKLASKIRESFNIEMPVNKIFETTSIKKLSEEIDLIKRSENLNPVIKITKTDKTTDLELSYAQQRMWFLQRFDPNNIANNIFTSFKLIGNLNIDYLNDAIQSIIERHEILRTYYSDNSGKPIQIIEENYESNFDLIDLSNLDDEFQKSEIDKIGNRTSSTIFNLEKLPLFKVVLIKIKPNEFVMQLVMHHIISDGWSINILIREIVELYKNKIENNNSSLPELAIQYSDYAQWEKAWLSGDNLNKQLDFWLNELSNIPEKIDLPLDNPRPPVQTFNGDHVEFSFSKESTKNLVAFAKKHNFTPYMIALAAFKILLHKYSHQDTIVVGSPNANRNKSEIQDLIGFFVNTLVIKTDFKVKDKVIDVLKRVREKTLEANLYQDVPFELLVDKLNTSREMSHSPLFQIAFVFQNENEQKLKLPDIEIEPIKSDIKVSKYDLSLYFQIRDEQIFGTVEYNIDLFNKTTIDRIIKHYGVLLSEVTRNPNKRITKLDLLTKEEYNRIIIDSNKTKVVGNYSRCINEVFEDRVNDFPQNTAVTYSEFEKNTLFTNEISYFELNTNANKLANYLIKKGVGPEKIIAISTSRSIDLITSILAVLKTGAAFLPVDPAYPKERIKYMIEDSECSFVLTQSFLSSSFSNLDGKVIYLDDENDSIMKESIENIKMLRNSSNLAYVIYTSGTTGRPKGTLLQHDGAINLAQVQKERFNINSQSKILQFSSLSFDAFVWETVMALLNGASLNMVSQEMINSSELLVDAIKALEITTITIPPSVLGVMNESNSELLKNLKTIIVAGEKCSAELAQKWQKQRQFVNAYGPTETTVCSSMFDCPPICEIAPPIGKPINNFELYVLDENLHPVPEGVIGELYISGISLARGYHKQPSLTASKFIPNPFSSEIGRRMYKSGDLVKRLETGDLDFVGRIDGQIKLRGFRIELTEIESVLSSFPTIKKAIVMVREDNPGNKQLVAYVIMKSDVEINISEIKTFLRVKLPEYMIPVTYVKLEKLPLTPSKKIDYNLLPKPDNISNNVTAEYVEPKTETEIVIANIGKELLGVDRMGVHDNFFELGGHSLLATQFVSKIKESLNKDVSLKTLFENPTIYELIEQFDSNNTETNSEEETIIQEREEEDLFDLLNEIENMTDEEAKSLLKNEKDDLS